jgi:hypothetical protein
MNPHRHTYMSDAVPHALMPMTATRIIVGGEPGDRKDWRQTQEEADAVKREALPAVADPADGIVGMGACMDSATRRPCQHAQACMRLAIAKQPLTCHVREAALDEAERAAERRAKILAQADAVLAYMRAAGEPVTLKDVAAALGYAETPLLLRGVWNHLVHNGRITIAGSSYQRGHRHTHYVKTWIITEEETS